MCLHCSWYACERVFVLWSVFCACAVCKRNNERKYNGEFVSESKSSVPDDSALLICLFVCLLVFFVVSFCCQFFVSVLCLSIGFVFFWFVHLFVRSFVPLFDCLFASSFVSPLFC